MIYISKPLNLQENERRCIQLRQGHKVSRSTYFRCINSQALITKTAVDIQIDEVGSSLCIEKTFVTKLLQMLERADESQPLFVSLLCKPVICGGLHFCQLILQWAVVCLSSETSCHLSHKLDWLCLPRLILPEIMVTFYFYFVK